VKQKTIAKGFSLIELIMVVAIGLVVAAMAVPSLSRGIATIRMRESLGGAASLLQRTRIEAVKSNRIRAARYQVVQNTPMVWVDTNGDNTIQSTEPQVQMAREVEVQFSPNVPPTSFPSSTLLGYNQTASPTPFNVGFNQRGLPCTPNTSTGLPSLCDLCTITTTAGSNNGFLYYFKMTSYFGDRWGAITVTPAGRIRVWMLTGSTGN